MRKIEDDVLDNGGGDGDNNQGDRTPSTQIPQRERTTRDKIFVAFGVVLTTAVLFKLLGVY